MNPSATTKRPNRRPRNETTPRRANAARGLIATLLAVALLFAGSSVATAGFETPTGPLTRRELHEIGLAAGFEGLAPGVSAAEALGIDQTQVDAYASTLCAGANPISPDLFIYPTDVPAFEAIFDDVAAQCPGNKRLLKVERGEIADLMESSNNLIEALDPTPRETDIFCDRLQEFDQITSKAIAFALARAFKLGDSSESLIENGVTLLIGSCPYLLG